MQSKKGYTIHQTSFEECLNDLNGISPLQMSKKLLEYELYDQQESIEVLNQIYDEFESNKDVTDELVTPIFFNIADGLIKHPKLGLNKTGITVSRLVGEIKNFSYMESHQMASEESLNKDNRQQATKNNTETKQYTGNRTQYDDPKKRKKYKEDYLQKRKRDEYTNKNNVAGKRPQTDHIVPLETAVKEYGSSPYLKSEELKKALNQDHNFAVINASLNASKGGSSNTEAVNKEHTIAGQQSEKTKQKMIQKEKEATAIVESELNQTVSNNLQADIQNIHKGESKLVNNAMNDAKEASMHRALGEVIILTLKPLYYEFNDILRNGIFAGLDENDKVKAFFTRLDRVKKYIFDNAIGSVFDIIKDFLKGFINFIINGVINAFVGLLKKVLKVITEGFTAIVGAMKILMKNKNDDGNPIPPAQKADAIVKLLATTAITFLGAYFEEMILGFLNGTPFEFLKDIIMIILTGIATTIVVWLIDQYDIFSVKNEKRLLRIKEIFQLRVQAIKENTDIFEKTSIEVFAKQKLQFKKIMSEMNAAIAQNRSVNTSAYSIADFMGIELHAKSTSQFIHLLETNKQLSI